MSTPEASTRPALCPTCDSSQPHLHPHRNLCPDSWHQPVPKTSDEWRREVHRWAGLLDQIVDYDIGGDAARRLSGDMRRALLGTDSPEADCG